MTFDLLIRRGRIVSSIDAAVGDVGIMGCKITEVGDLSASSAKEEIDAKHLLVMPGLIDTQVHFREPGLTHKEDIESGTRAAIHGGVTSILEMPNTSPPTVSEEALQDKLRRAAGRAWCDFGFFVGATHENVYELARLEGLPGTAGVKVFMGSSTGTLLIDDDEGLLLVLRNASGPVAVHAEDEARNRERKSRMASGPVRVSLHPDIRDAESARLATERLIRLSRQAGRPVHILHISTQEELPLIAQAKAEGLKITAEVTPQHLWFTAPDCYGRLGTNAQMNPPIRSKEHNDALWQALTSGLFDIFGSDHAPHTLEEKAKPYPESPSGMPGVQTMLPVLMTFARQGRLAWTDIVRLACNNPTTLYGIEGKGRIAPGFDADLVLVDPERSLQLTRAMIQSKCGWSPYEGEELTGWPEAVILGGQVVVRNDERVGHPMGEMLQFAKRG